MAVIFHLARRNSLDLKVFEDHRLMRPRAECLPERKQDHCHSVARETGDEVEEGKGEDVERERGDHRLASPVGIGDHPRRDLKQVCSDRADREEHPDLQEREPALTEEEDDERVEETKVLQEPVRAEFAVHHIFKNRHNCSESSYFKIGLSVLLVVRPKVLVAAI